RLLLRPAHPRYLALPLDLLLDVVLRRRGVRRGDLRPSSRLRRRRRRLDARGTERGGARVRGLFDVDHEGGVVAARRRELHRRRFDAADLVAVELLALAQPQRLRLARILEQGLAPTRRDGDAEQGKVERRRRRRL